MTILIDTNVIINLYQFSYKLKPETAGLLQSAKQLYISSIAFIEIGIKKSKHPKSLIKSAEEYLKIARQEDFSILDVNADIAPILETLPLHHKDPFDRIMIAQAMHYDLALLSSDKQFRQYDIELIEV